MRKDTKILPHCVDILSGTQKNLLLHIFQHGPSSAYGTHKILNRSQSTVQTAMKGLKEVGLIRLYEEKNGERGGKKILYGLTITGFCYGFHLIVQDSTTTYDIIESAIRRWKELCPEVLDNWDLLIKERQGLCLSSSDSRKSKYGWQNVQLPYLVPDIEAKYWIIFLDTVCQNRIETHRRDRIRRFEDLPSEYFADIFVKAICNLLNKPVDYFDVRYMIRIIREIPDLWDPWLLGNLVALKKYHEITAISIGRQLEELGYRIESKHIVGTIDDLEQWIQHRNEIGDSEL